MFLCRYWYLDSTEEIAEKSGFTVSKVKSMLFRIRKRLYAQLTEEYTRIQESFQAYPDKIYINGAPIGFIPAPWSSPSEMCAALRGQ